MIKSNRSARLTRPRSRAFALALLSSTPFAGLSGCGNDAPPPVPASSEPPAPEPVPTVCPADAAQIPTFALTAATTGDHLSPEPLAVPTRGRCPHEHTLMEQPGADQHHASLVQTSQGRRLALHQIHQATTLPAKNLVLAAAESGLWAYDVASMARLARLVDRSVHDVAVSADGSRFAYVAKDAVPADAPREIVVVAVDGLSVVRRFANAPTGRLRLSNDGTKVVLADGDEGVHLLDVASGATRNFKPKDTVEDAFLVPGTAGTVAYVGDDNAVAYQDLISGRAVPQSSAGAAPLTVRRDLKTLIVDPATGRTYTGGEDNEIHAYEGMPGEAPHEVAHTRLSGNVVDVACCSSDGHIATITDVAQVAWLSPTLEVTRQIGPFLPSLASTPARVSLAGDRTLVSLVGRAFVWTRDGMFVEPDSFVGEEVARVEKDGRVVLVVRSRGRLEFHRFEPSDALDRESTLLTAQAWAIVDSTFQGPDDSVVFIGRAQGRVVGAVIPKTGDAILIRGPLVGVLGVPHAVASADGKRFGLWNLEDRVVELDLDAKAFRTVGAIEGERSARYDVEWNGGSWAVTDADGHPRTLAAVAVAAPRELTAPR